MSWADPYQAMAITDLQEFRWEFHEGEVQVTEGAGWDLWPFVAISRQPGLSETQVAGQFQQGQRIGGNDFWLQSWRVRCLGGDIWTADCNALGLVRPKAVELTYSSSAQEYGGLDTTVEGRKLAGLLSTPTVETAEIVRAFPGTEKIGDNDDPPVVPAVAPPHWDWLLTSGQPHTVHWPYGWILTAANFKGLQGVPSIYLVKKTYQYQYQVTP